MKLETTLPLLLLLSCSNTITATAADHCSTLDDYLNQDNETETNTTTQCTIDQLPVSELEKACAQLGVSLLDLLMNESNSSEEEEKEDKETSSSLSDFTDEEVRNAGSLCVTLLQDLYQMQQEDPDALLKMEQEMMQQDPEAMIDVITDVLKNDPKLIDELIDELKTEDPEIYEALKAELAEGETFYDRPELVSSLVVMMLSQQDEMQMAEGYGVNDEGNDEL